MTFEQQKVIIELLEKVMKLIKEGKFGDGNTTTSMSYCLGLLDGIVSILEKENLETN